MYISKFIHKKLVLICEINEIIKHLEHFPIWKWFRSIINWGYFKNIINLSKNYIYQWTFSDNKNIYNEELWLQKIKQKWKQNLLCVFSNFVLALKYKISQKIHNNWI